MSLVMGAAPAGSEAEDEQRQSKAMFEYDISVIADSPFGKTRAGGEIAKLLRSLNQRGNVVYGGTSDESRGDWDGQTIRVNEDFRGKFFPTTLELVHEGSHAVWRKSHPKKTSEKDKREDDIADELNAQQNQLLVYKYLKAKKGCPNDAELEQRLVRQANGTLRQPIEEK